MPSMGLSTGLFLSHPVQAIQFVARVANVQVKLPVSDHTTFIWKASFSPYPGVLGHWGLDVLTTRQGGVCEDSIKMDL